MLNQIFTTKGQMGELYVEQTRKSVTWLTLPEQVVTQVKAADKDGYLAVQIGIGKRKNSPRWHREIRLTEATDLKVGDVLPIDQIVGEGDTVKITGVSKGKGFQGVMKRHHFAGGPRTHGQSDRGRAPGSISRGTTPGRVLKGQPMAGRMGSDTTSVRNVKVLALDLENRKLAVSGAVPGARTGLVTLTVLKHV